MRLRWEKLRVTDLNEFIKAKVEELRPRLLDLTKRNPLISTRLKADSSTLIRVVDELPDVLFYKLTNDQEMRLLALPPLDDDPQDEQTEEFRSAYANARLIDELFLKSIQEIDDTEEDHLNKISLLERDLKDRLREDLGLKPRTKKGDKNLSQHALNNKITPSYDLPIPDDGHEDERHSDNDIQTLLLPTQLERRLNGITTKCKTWQQETGLNVLRIGFGLLEWAGPTEVDPVNSPLILLSATLEKTRTPTGIEYRITTTGDEAEINSILSEKLSRDFGLILPEFKGHSIEDYLMKVSETAPKNMTWRVKRQVVVGIFPSARLAMYHDLDTNSDQFISNSIVSNLLAGVEGDGSLSQHAEVYEIDHPEIENKVPNIFLEADSSQFSALVDVANGKNLAIEGPPGTGKSQTIVNAIAAAMLEGKKILFVAEKLAALNVVRARLEAIGLGEFILPLQAERSSREQIVQSLRDRLQIDYTTPPYQFEEKKLKFEGARSQIADYLSLSGSTFGNTELSVRNILVKETTTRDFLSEVPNDVLSQCNLSNETLTKKTIKEVSEKGTKLKDSINSSNVDKRYWEGAQLESSNRFAVEEVIQNTKECLRKYNELGASFSELTEVHQTSSFQIDHVSEISHIVEALSQIPSENSGYIAVDLMQPDTSLLVSKLISQYNEAEQVGRELKPFFVDLQNVDLPNSLGQLADFCKMQKLETLNLETLESQLEAKIKLRVQLKDTLVACNGLMATLPEAHNWTLSQISVAYRLISNAGQQALSLRNPAMADVSAPILMDQIIAIGEELKHEQLELANRFSFTFEIKESEIKEAITFLRNSGRFKAFSAGYRKAKSFYKSISKQPDFDQNLAIPNLERLLIWLNSKSQFENNIQAQTIFGLHFDGLKSNFSQFTKLSEFYTSIQKSLAGPENRVLRDFLKNAELDDVLTIPNIDVNSKVSLSQLESYLETLDKVINTNSSNLETVQGQLQIFATPNNIDISKLTDLHDSLIKYRLLRKEISQNKDAKDVLRDLVDGELINVDPAERILQICQGVTHPNEGFVELLRNIEIKQLNKKIQNILGKQQEAEKTLQQVCNRVGFEKAALFDAKSIIEIQNFLKEASIDEDGLREHSNVSRALLEISNYGLLPLAEYAIENDRLKELPQLFEAYGYNLLARRVMHEHHLKLDQFTGDTLNGLRAELANLDRELIKLSRLKLRQQLTLNANPPAGIGSGPKKNWTELSLIENEVEKRQRYISPRDLTKRAAKALIELKPCWMMSPLAVAQYIEKGAIEFDLVIIDEASQMPPENAVGALLRGKQVMIVGDTNQLPPSNFFKTVLSNDDDDDDDASTTEESILEMANITFRPKRRLNWHYRSRHSGLIKYSNRTVYDDTLIVFPSPSEVSPHMGVAYKKVNGLYKSGTNPIEAKVVVDAILEHMRTDKDRSLGVVTLNKKQRDLIFEEFEFALSKDKDAQEYIDQWRQKDEGLEEFFIKNLENVQGDERDVIFIGTVYGPEVEGSRPHQRFGPINGLAGKRRLNVLFSRAKQKIVTFSSMTSADILADEKSNPGTFMLKGWLEYSATGKLEAGTITGKEPDSEFEEYVIDQIKAMGCEPIPQVGVAGYFIDIGIKHPDWPHGFILGVECDGAAYHSSKSARDRDRYRQEILEGLGWELHRIWSTDWFNNPRKEGERLREIISARLETLKSTESQYEIDNAPTHTHSIVREDLFELSEVHENEVEPVKEADTPKDTSISDLSVQVGDTVRVKYLTGDMSTYQFSISENDSAPEKGIIHQRSPIANALLGAEEGEEVEVLIGSKVRSASIEEIVKAEAAQ